MAIDRQKIGRRIQAQRKTLGLTQATLAERAELDTAYLASVERGARSLSLEALDRVAAALKTNLSQLLEGKRADKADAVTRELRELVDQWTPAQRRAVLKALRALTDL